MYNAHTGRFRCEILSRQIDNDESELLLEISKLHEQGRKKERKFGKSKKKDRDPRDIHVVPTEPLAYVDYAILPIRCLDVTGTTEANFRDGFELNPENPSHEINHRRHGFKLATAGFLVCEHLEYNGQHYYKQSLYTKGQQTLI